MKQNPTILICYLELAGYFLNCIEVLIKETGSDVHIVKKETNKEAPFNFKYKSSKIHLYNYNDLDFNALYKLALEIKPDLLYCGGWSEKKYLKLAKKIKHSTTTIIGFDNKWKGNLKQQVLLYFGKLLIKPKFDYAFVPGEEQKKFALKLGFKNDKILLGLYSADIDTYNKIAELNNREIENKKNKHFLYVGRYIKHKGIFDMWKAFIELQNEKPNDWELWCIGTGEEFDNRPIHPKIRHLGFVQPKDMINHLKPNGVFILPSHFEPWGVAVHEMIAAGYPLILSSEVGAKEVFLDGNGFEVEPRNSESIKKAMKKIILLEDERLKEMSTRSIELSKKISPTTWSKQIIRVLE